MKHLNLQYLIFEHPYSTFKNKYVSDMFNKVLEMKVSNYCQTYGFGVLPIDTTDFIATHHILCLKKNNQLLPILAYKTISTYRCQLHQQRFTLNDLMLNSNAHQLEKKFNNTFKNKNISYGFGWTHHKSYAKSFDLKKIFIGLLYNYYDSQKFDLISCLGVLSVKTDIFFQKYGYKLLENYIPRSNNLFQLSCLNNTDVKILMTDRLNQDAKKEGLEFLNLWNSKIVVPHEIPEKLKIAS